MYHVALYVYLFKRTSTSALSIIIIQNEYMYDI